MPRLLNVNYDWNRLYLTMLICLYLEMHPLHKIYIQKLKRAGCSSWNRYLLFFYNFIFCWNSVELGPIKDIKLAWTTIHFSGWGEMYKQTMSSLSRLPKTYSRLTILHSWLRAWVPPPTMSTAHLLQMCHLSKFSNAVPSLWCVEETRNRSSVC